MTKHTTETRAIKPGDLALISGIGDVRKDDLDRWRDAVVKSLKAGSRLTFGYVVVFAVWRQENTSLPDSDYAVGSPSQRSFWRGAYALVQRGISPVSTSADNRAAWDALAGLGKMPGGLAKAASARKESGRGMAVTLPELRKRIHAAADQKSAARPGSKPGGKPGKDDGQDVEEVADKRQPRPADGPQDFRSALADVKAALAALKVAAPVARTDDMDEAQRMARSFVTWTEQLTVTTTASAAAVKAARKGKAARKAGRKAA